MTYEDFQEIRRIVRSEVNELRIELKGEMVTKEDIANMATKEDITNMATKEDIANMATKEDIAKLETYMHHKFAIIESDIVPKINALYEMADRNVTHDECRREREEISQKTDYISPLVLKVREHSDRINKLDNRITKIESLA